MSSILALSTTSSLGCKASSCKPGKTKPVNSSWFWQEEKTSSLTTVSQKSAKKSCQHPHFPKRNLPTEIQVLSYEHPCLNAAFQTLEVDSWPNFSWVSYPQLSSQSLQKTTKKSQFPKQFWPSSLFWLWKELQVATSDCTHLTLGIYKPFSKVYLTWKKF